MSPRPLDVVSRAIWVPRSTPPDALARVQALATHLGAALRRGARVRVVGLPLVPVAWVDAALMGAVARGYLFLPRQYPPISRGDWRQYLQEHTDLKGVSGAMWLILRTERDRKTAPRYSNGQLMPAWNYQEPCWLFSRDVGRWLEADGYCVAFAEDLPGVPVDTALEVAP